MYLPRDLLLDLLMNLPLDNRLSLDTDLSLILPLLGGGDRDIDLSQRISIEEDLKEKKYLIEAKTNMNNDGLTSNKYHPIGCAIPHHKEHIYEIYHI